MNNYAEIVSKVMLAMEHEPNLTDLWFVDKGLIAGKEENLILILAALERGVDLFHLYNVECFSIHDLANLPAPVYVVDKLIPENSLVIIYGASRSLKSFLLVDLARAIVQGEPWHNEEPCKKGAVLIVAAEGQAGLGKRARGLLKHHKINPKMFKVMTKPFRLNQDTSVSGFIAQVRLLEKIHNVKFSVISIDTISKCSPGAEQSKHEVISLIIDKLYEIQRSLNVTVIGVHHTNRNEEEFNGSYVFKSGVDTLIKVSREGAKGFKGKLKVEKQKDDDEIEFEYGVVEVDITRDGGKMETTLVVERVGSNVITGIEKAFHTDDEKNTTLAESIKTIKARSDTKQRLGQASTLMLAVHGYQMEIPFEEAFNASLTKEERQGQREGRTPYNKDRFRKWFPLNECVAIGNTRVMRYTKENPLNPNEPDEFIEITRYE